LVSSMRTISGTISTQRCALSHREHIGSMQRPAERLLHRNAASWSAELQRLFASGGRER